MELKQLKTISVRDVSKYEDLGISGNEFNKLDLSDLLDNLLEEKLNFKIEDLEKERLILLLRKADICPGTDIDDMLKKYEDALEVSNAGYKVVHKRDIDEVFVNNYSPEWIRNWDGNMDLQLCLDLFAIVTYISDYYGKDDSGTLEHIKGALKQAENEFLKSKQA